MISASAALALRFAPAVSAGDDPEFSQVLRIADPSVAIDGALTFLPAPDLAADAWLAEWDRWRSTLFEPCLAGILEAAARHAALGQAREIRELDLNLSTVLPEPAADRSGAAGRRLYEAMRGVRGERWFNKLQTGAADGTLPGHFAIAYACRYASFHLPGRLLAPTLSYWEWTAALADRPPASGALPEFTAVTPAPAESEAALRASGLD